MCHDLLQLWNRRCKFLRQFAIWLLFLETFDGGALYLGGMAECNLGVGHFHEVAAWSPYHLSQKASQTWNMKHSNSGANVFKPLEILSTPSLSFHTLDDYSITWRMAIEQPCMWYGVLCSVGQSDGISQPGQCWIVRMETRGNSLLSPPQPLWHSNTFASQESSHAMIWKHRDP